MGDWRQGRHGIASLVVCFWLTPECCIGSRIWIMDDGSRPWRWPRSAMPMSALKPNYGCFCVSEPPGPLPCTPAPLRLLGCFVFLILSLWPPQEQATM
ncbi:hypothetical protein BDP67DRAFT_563936 [Colletotrichum lupini]|nr:hypothetical protein BDP67DRAFT_563936 [Colletotrichum lupini]